MKRSIVCRAILTGVLAACCRATAAEVPLEWNERYPTDVPYETELEPAKLGLGQERLVVAADGRMLETTALAGVRPGSVRLRFAVPAGTKTLACRTASGVRTDAAASPDNLLAGLLTPARWEADGKVAVTPAAGGLRFAAADAENRAVTAEADLPAGLTGGERSVPVRVEVDLRNASTIVWGNGLFIEQLDADGNPLPERMTDSRWMTHMLPPRKKVAYRENGRIHPRARKLRVRFEMHSRNPAFDAYGIRREQSADALARLELTRLVVRPAAELPFPRLDRDFFPAGVGGEAADRALALGPQRAFWYQTRGMGAWAGDGKFQYREEREVYFPAGEGTVEAWFFPEWAKAGTAATYHLFSGGSHTIPLSVGDTEHKGRGQLFAVTYAPASKELAFFRRDMKDRTFVGKAKAGIPAGAWTHVACTFAPGKTARVFVNGRRVLEVPLAGYEPLDLAQDPLPNNRDVTIAMVGAPMMDACLSERPRAPYLTGRVDLWRVSSTVRYADEFTPPKRLEVDGATRALFTFDLTKDGTSGGGMRFIPGTLLAEKGLVGLTAEKDGRTMAYRPAKIAPQDDPFVVLDRENYKQLPTPDDCRAARRRVRRTYAVADAGAFAAFDLPSGVAADYVEIVNRGGRPLEYPIVLNAGDLDARSFGDFADSLDIQGLSDREKVDKTFNFLLKASDYFCADTATYEPDSPSPENVQVKALMMLNAYCGFECGPLNTMVCNLFACSAGCPANMTGGYGHSFQEVFFEGKNHLYDLSAQQFFPSWDNETSASLGEDEEEPGIHNRMGSRAGHFIRQATRRCSVTEPGYRAKAGVVLNPGERFRAWFDNAGVVNDLFCARRLDAGLRAGRRHYAGFEDVTEDCMAVADQARLRRFERFFPQAANGFLEFDGRPTPENPAFVDEGVSFRYRVTSPYPITAASYVARRKDGSTAPLAFSFDGGRSWREVAGTDFDYPVRARLAYWVRVKAPMKEVTRLTARTTVQFNARIFPGRVRPGRNAFRFGSQSGGQAEVTLAWREDTGDEIVFKGGLMTGFMPGAERSTVFVDPAKGPVAIEAVGSKEGTLMLSPASDRPHFEYVTARSEHGGERTLTVVVCPGFRYVPAAAAKLAGGAKFCAADADSVQDRVVLASAGDRVTFAFEPLKPGRYAIWSVCRFPGHSPILRAMSLDVRLGNQPEKARGVRAVNTLVNYYKAEYGAKDGRGPWKWDVALDPKTSYPYEGVAAFACPDGLSELTFSLRSDISKRIAQAGGVELAGVVVMPWPEEAKFRQDLLKILGGVNCAPERVK